MWKREFLHSLCSPVSRNMGYGVLIASDGLQKQTNYFSGFRDDVIASER